MQSVELRFKSLAVLLLALVAACVPAHAARDASQGVREPAVAGQFYPADPKALEAALDAYLKDAIPASGQRPLALVAPHAGYIFSGQIAADAWNQAAGGAYDTVVLLGTNHSGLNTRRVAVFPAGGLRTPLGVVPVDAELVQALLAVCGECAADPAPHLREHSIEVQLPFVQRLFPRAKIVAAVVGPEDPTLPERFGRALATVLRGRQALIVASSDLSHYPPASEAAAVDRRTLEAIASLDADRLRSVTGESEARGIRELATCACGDAPIRAAIAAARALGATRGHVVSYANSADVAVGEPDRVVGYGAVALTAGARGIDTSGLPTLQAPGDATLTAADRQRLLALARETIRRYLESGTVPLGRGFSIAADRHQGLFVTLNKHGRLRGCIGQMQPSGPIRRLVATMALAAAFQDRAVRQGEGVGAEGHRDRDLAADPVQAGPLGRGRAPRARRRGAAEVRPVGRVPAAGGHRGGLESRRVARQPVPEGRPARGLLGERREAVHVPGGGVRGEGTQIAGSWQPAAGSPQLAAGSRPRQACCLAADRSCRPRALPEP